MEKIKKSVTLNMNVAKMIQTIANNLGITENAVISVAVANMYKDLNNLPKQ